MGHGQAKKEKGKENEEEMGMEMEWDHNVAHDHSLDRGDAYSSDSH